LIIKIDENVYIFANQIVVVELEEIINPSLGEKTYRWVFYTTSPERPIINSKIFENKEEALKWFEKIKDKIGE